MRCLARVGASGIQPADEPNRAIDQDLVFARSIGVWAWGESADDSFISRGDWFGVLTSSDRLVRPPMTLGGISAGRNAEAGAHYLQKWASLSRGIGI